MDFSFICLKGNSTVKTNRAQINVHTFNKLFLKNLGPNHLSKGEIVRQSSRIIQFSTPSCSFPCRCKSGQRQECDVMLRNWCCSRNATVFILQPIMNVDVLSSSSGGSSDSGSSSSSGESLDGFHDYILEGGDILCYQFEPRRANGFNGETAETEPDQNMSTDEEESSVRLGNLDW